MRERDTSQAKMALDRQEMIRCRLEMERWLRKVQGGLIKKTCKSLHVSFTVREDLTEIAQ